MSAAEGEGGCKMLPMADKGGRGWVVKANADKGGKCSGLSVLATTDITDKMAKNYEIYWFVLN